MGVSLPHFGAEQLCGIDLELQHLRGFAAAVAAFALHGDAADLEAVAYRWVLIIEWAANEVLIL